MMFLGTAVVLALLGYLLWLVNFKLDFNDKTKNTVNAVTVTAMIWLLYTWGTYPGVQPANCICP